MATTVAPDALYDIYELIDPYFDTMKVGGVVGDAKHGSGYHLSRARLLERGLTRDYSIQCPADKRGPSNAACGIDITFGRLSELVTVHRRLKVACENKDPRIAPVRETIGTLDGKNVSGYNRVATGTGSRSRVGWHPDDWSNDSHLWHEHVSVLRDYCDDRNMMRGLAEVIAGVPRGKFGWKGDVDKTDSKPDVTPTYLGPYWTTRETLAVHPTKGDIPRPRGFAVTTGKTISNSDPKAPVLITEAGYRYRLADLSKTKPLPLISLRAVVAALKTGSALEVGVDGEQIQIMANRAHQRSSTNYVIEDVNGVLGHDTRRSLALLQMDLCNKAGSRLTKDDCWPNKGHHPDCDGLPGPELFRSMGIDNSDDN
jgi:hypothetical protein